jgi:hypothetical protein
VTRLAGDPRAARDVFLAFIADEPREFRAGQARAAAYMHWVDGDL